MPYLAVYGSVDPSDSMSKQKNTPLRFLARHSAPGRPYSVADKKPLRFRGKAIGQTVPNDWLAPVLDEVVAFIHGQERASEISHDR